MRIILLAAGRGERLWPLTSSRPKPLIPILCKPLLDWHLDAIRESLGESDLTLVIGYKGEMIESRLRELRVNKYELVVQDPPMGTGDAVRKALMKTGVQDEYVFLYYSDVFIYPQLLRWVIEKLVSERPSILGVRVSDVSQLGELLVSSDDRLLGVREKTGETRPGVVNGGLMVLQSDELSDALSRIGLSPRGEYELTDALTMLADKLDINVVKIGEDDWSDIGTPWGYLEINRRVLGRMCGDKEECIFNEGFLEQRGSNCIEGRAYIGGPVEIGPFAHLRGDNVLCGNNKVGFSTQLKSSVVLEGAKLPHLNYVGDSVVGSKVNMGAGAITANLRHDEKHIKSMLKGKLVSTGMKKLGSIIGDEARIGINASLLPGVKIGYRAWIGSGCIVDRDVPDYSLVKCRQEIEIEKREADNED
jgi:bifunctional UDP-N-acetylglucosamine pyrophosphorylase/glucosamine-1-phosphate N-acetyltransferase